MRQFLVVLATLAAVSSSLPGCTKTAQSDDDGDDDAPAVDANPGVGCTTTTPRSIEPELFVAPQGLQPRITAFIDGAQHTLDIQMYLFTVTAIMDRVVAAKQRGVTVRVLLDPDHAGNANARTRLSAGGVTHRDAPSIYSFSHAKYMIADGATALIMSANFNVDAMDRERNYGIIDRDPDDVADLQAIYNMDWAAGGGEAAMPADLTCTRLVVSPNNAKQRILELVNSATATLEVEALYVSEITIRNAIGAAKARGVDVRVILDGSTDNADTKTYFVGQGIPVHDASGFLLHAKLIIADGVAFVGSENFSQTALTKNREVGALVFEPAQAARAKQQFDTDFAATL